ncbi:MAG TPA: amidohydrolase family protein [Acidobacteriota bacterium]|nr:amidohydrolase family protein [Acidobacteriota bacterium]
MAYLLRDATIITLDPPSVQRADLRIEDGRIAGRETQLAPQNSDEVLNLGGRFIMPGMVCAHTHLYSTLARGMPGPRRAPGNFNEILEFVWWRLDRALDEETIYWSALAGALEAAQAGTTCLYDHHASPYCIRGSLQIVREAIERAGLRAVLCYEVTDRGGRKQRDDGIEENRAFLEWVHSGPGTARFRALVGAHASFTMSAGALEACVELMRTYGSGIHIHAAEDPCDEEDARSKYGMGIMERLSRAEALNEHAIIAHGTHLQKPAIDIGRAAGAWFAHNPRSNMNNRVGYAPVADFGERLLMGTDGLGADLFAEADFAFYKGRDAGSGFEADQWLQVLANNQRRASQDFGADLSSLAPGSAADLVVLSYQPPTLLTPGNLPWHLIFGMTSAHVESVMVDGNFVVTNRQPAADSANVYEHARKAGEKLWARIQGL